MRAPGVPDHRPSSIAVSIQSVDPRWTWIIVFGAARALAGHGEHVLAHSLVEIGSSEVSRDIRGQVLDESHAGVAATAPLVNPREE